MPETTRRVMLISTHGYVSSQIEFGKPDTGGQVVYVLELAKCMGRFGFQVDLYTRRFEGQDEIEQVDENTRIVRVPCGGEDFIGKETLCEFIPEWVENAKRKVDEVQKVEGKYTFINTHYWDAGLAGMGLAKHLDIPHIFTPHSIGAWKRKNMDGDPAALEKQYNFNRRVHDENLVFDDCDSIIATTPQQRDILHGSEYNVAPAKIHVIPPGYDDTKYFPISEASRAALRSDHGFDGRVVMALGRIARNKGYDLLIKAMPEVLKRHRDAKLLLAIGSTEPSKAEREMVEGFKELASELGIRDRVIFGDYIPDEEMPDFYRMADVFCLCSRYEPFGMTAVEAMACGTPTVITTEGGLWERVSYGQQALYANPFDPYEYGAAIHALLQHPRLWANTSRDGSHLARAEFTWVGIAQQVINLVKTSDVMSEHDEARAEAQKNFSSAGA